jgi:hypothetical protein
VTMNTVVYMFIMIGVSTISTKRCKGRVRTGSSCRSRCNYATGKWQRKLCAAAFIPPPDYQPCFTITGKECRLPFEYEGDRVHTCTLKNSVNRKPWCVTDVTGEQEDCSPDNEVHCTKHEGYCAHFCETPESGEIKCSYKYSGEYRLGMEIPAMSGDCNDKGYADNSPILSICIIFFF